MSESKSRKKEFIYVAVNPAMDGYVKVGKTTNLKARLQQLNGTNVPLPFIYVYAAEVDDMDSVERKIHKTFADRRVVNPKREFFEIDPDRIKDALSLMHQDIREEIDPENINVIEKEDQKSLERAQKKREAFNFSMVNIRPGEILYLKKDLDLKKDEIATCVVVGNNKVKFKDTDMSLSKSAGIALLEGHGFKGPWSGPEQWAYKDETYGEETLNDRRKRMEAED